MVGWGRGAVRSRMRMGMMRMIIVFMNVTYVTSFVISAPHLRLQSSCFKLNSACSLPRGQLAITPRTETFSKRMRMSSQEASRLSSRDPSVLFPIFLCAAVVNRILYRVQLVPMKEYTYFISQFATLSYVFAYSILLFQRKSIGKVNNSMLQYARNNWNIFAIIGALEATTFLLALYSAARLPGSLISVIGQGGILWSVLFARLILGKSFDRLQLLGVLVVLIGVLTCTVPQLPAGALVTQQHRFELWAFSGMYLLSSAFSAISFTLKEKCLKEGELDIIIVSCFGSLAQCIFTFLLLPFTLAIATNLPPQVYFQKGFAAFCGATHSCMPWLFFAYMVANLSLNLSGIALTKRGGAVGTFVIGTVLVPITSLVFCLNIPLLGASRFSWIFVGGLLFTTAGSLLYNHQKVRNMLQNGAGK